jgi:hypothetical protein
MFSIPGIALGLLVAYLAFIPVGNALANFTLAPVPLVLTGSAIGLSVGVGFVMPLVSLIGPVQRALGKTLRDALDLYHTVINDVTVTITKLENLGLSPLQLNSSLLMVSFGFVVYYLIPMSFIFLNLVLFFNIFVAILLGAFFKWSFKERTLLLSFFVLTLGLILRSSAWLEYTWYGCTSTLSEN